MNDIDVYVNIYILEHKKNGDRGLLPESLGECSDGHRATNKRAYFTRLRCQNLIFTEDYNLEGLELLTT